MLMKKPLHKLTRHHLLPKSKWWNSNPKNILKLKENSHRAFHLIFANDEPIEQIQTLLSLNTTVLTDSFRNDILDILDNNDEYIYERGIFKPSRRR